MGVILAISPLLLCAQSKKIDSVRFFTDTSTLEVTLTTNLGKVIDNKMKDEVIDGRFTFVMAPTSFTMRWFAFLQEGNSEKRIVSRLRLKSISRTTNPASFLLSTASSWFVHVRLAITVINCC